MRMILIVILTAIIFLQANTSLSVCNLDTAKQAINPRIFYEQTIDGKDQNISLTRFLHNKIGVYASEFGKCYANVFDPNFIYHSVGAIGLVGWFYFVYLIAKRRLYPIIAILAVLPLLPFLKLSPLPILWIYKLFAIIGLAFLFYKSK